MDRDLYEILDVSPDADARSIRAAYRTLARRCHPDLTGDPQAARHMAELNAAFEVLGNLGRRAAYDQVRRQAARSAGVDRRERAARSETRAAPGSAAGYGSHAGQEGSWTRAGNRQSAGYGSQAAPSGSILPFGRYQGWSLGEIARADPYYLVWLEGRSDGRPYAEEVRRLLGDLGFHATGTR